ncbi:hypothetical protein AVEN_16524-1 [Araneus ventricosus]|uniref:Uncharacterized protein n=1 Tax=Araneus ventricosus TaxID=182803 RepID=A0A4Y2PQT3_ARAVE|nr:hypothetical protein AVEN_16524-1 [Araneus ventricosus]
MFCQRPLKLNIYQSSASDVEAIHTISFSQAIHGTLHANPSETGTPIPHLLLFPPSKCELPFTPISPRAGKLAAPTPRIYTGRISAYMSRQHIYKPYPDRTEAGNQSISLATRSSDVVFSSRTKRTAIITKQESSYFASPFSHS